MKIITKDEFASVTANGVVLVDFFATWCGPCKMLGPVLEQLQESYQEKVTIVKVDVDQEGDLAMKYNIMSVPTMIIFKDGEAVKQLSGFQPAPQLKAAIDTYL